MKNTFGYSVTATIFGESHGEQIGVVLDGLAPGIRVDHDFISHQLFLRRPSGRISTPRQEKDEYSIVSGVFNGYTTGTPVTILIPNTNTKSKDYSKTRFLARPGHADYTAFCKYHGFEDYRGGGHFSGRITAPVVAAGAIAITALKSRGITVGTHIRKCAGIADAELSQNEAELNRQLEELNGKQFAVLREGAQEEMTSAIEAAAAKQDSVGGILETAVTGLPAGVGEPWFDSLESVLAHGLFSIPAVKGVEFGKGFEIVDMLGSKANDSFRTDGQKVTTETNNNGGINGGISNGMPVIVRTAVKPTPSIAQEQQTINFENNENASIEIVGRHDPSIIHRARVVQDSIVALVLMDMLALRYGTDWFMSEK